MPTRKKQNPKHNVHIMKEALKVLERTHGTPEKLQKLISDYKKTQKEIRDKSTSTQIKMLENEWDKLLDPDVPLNWRIDKMKVYEDKIEELKNKRKKEKTVGGRIKKFFKKLSKKR